MQAARANQYLLTLITTATIIGMAALSACGGGEQAAAPVENPDLIVKVQHVDQYRELAGELPDGQYVVLTLNLENTSTQSLDILPTDFELEKIADNPEDVYTQTNETGLLSAFIKTYGDEHINHLLENVSSPVYPKRAVQRYLIYMLPSKGDPAKFRLLYKPYNIAIPLVSEETLVKDHRTATAVDSSPVSDEESAEDEESDEDKTSEDSSSEEDFSEYPDM